MTAQAVVVRGTKIASRVIGKGTPGAKGDPGGNVLSIGLFTAASGFTIAVGTDLVRTAGYSTKGVGIAEYVNDDATVTSGYVTANPRTSFISANGRGFRLVSSGRMFNVRAFGAKGDSNITASAGTDDTAAIQAAINFINGIGGGALYFPEGYYKVTTYLTLCQRLRLIGASRQSSMLVTAAAGGGGASLDQSVRNGSIFYSNWTSNGSTTADITIEHLGLQCANLSNVGAGFYDNCGAYITLHDVYIKNFKYCIIFDQTEIANILGCSLAAANSSGADIWLVNGADLKAGNVGGFTNVITVARTQLNAGGSTVNLIQDDGGYTHTFADNNYNAGNIQIRIAGIPNFVVSGGEFESAGSNVVSINSTSAAGTGVGGASGTFNGGEYTGSTDGNIQINSGGTLSFKGCAFLTPSVYPIKGVANASYVSTLGCISTRADRALFDSYNTHVWDDRIEMGIRTNLGQPTWTLTNGYLGVFTQCTNASGNAATVPNDTTMPAPVGSNFFLEQTSTGQVSVIAGSGVTVTGPLTTSKQGQKLHLRKTAANTWQTSRRFSPPETGWAAWTGTANKATKDTATATLTDVAQTMKAVVDALIAQGIIGA